MGTPTHCPAPRTLPTAPVFPWQVASALWLLPSKSALPAPVPRHLRKFYPKRLLPPPRGTHDPKARPHVLPWDMISLFLGKVSWFLFMPKVEAWSHIWRIQRGTKCYELEITKGPVRILALPLRHCRVISHLWTYLLNHKMEKIGTFLWHDCRDWWYSLWNMLGRRALSQCPSLRSSLFFSLSAC